LTDLNTRVANMISRVRLKEINTDGDQQTTILDGVAGEVIGGNHKVAHLQQFGFTSTPPAGSEGLMLCLGGNRDQSIVIGLESPGDKPTGVPGGGTKMYDNGGQYFEMHGGESTIKVGKLTIIADSVVVESGSIDLGGEGGHAVARKDVDYVEIDTGSSSGKWPIKSGSDTVRSL